MRNPVIEPYDDAVDSALERDDEPDGYLRYKTSARERSAENEFQQLLERYWTALQGEV